MRFRDSSVLMHYVYDRVVEEMDSPTHWDKARAAFLVALTFSDRSDYHD